MKHLKKHALVAAEFFTSVTARPTLYLEPYEDLEIVASPSSSSSSGGDGTAYVKKKGLALKASPSFKFNLNTIGSILAKNGNFGITLPDSINGKIIQRAAVGKFDLTRTTLILPQMDVNTSVGCCQASEAMELLLKNERSFDTTRSIINEITTSNIERFMIEGAAPPVSSLNQILDHWNFKRVVTTSVPLTIPNLEMNPMIELKTNAALLKHIQETANVYIEAKPSKGHLKNSMPPPSLCFSSFL